MYSPLACFDFNPRTPCGVRQISASPGHPFQRISIHAPRVGCDPCTSGFLIIVKIFQSTHPVWGATRSLRLAHTRILNFNPRTPCGVRPVLQAAHRTQLLYFNPRTPCGVRHVHVGSCSLVQEFQSTHPVWGATICTRLHLRHGKYFNPRTPCGVRQLGGCKSGVHRHFNPRTPCGVRHVEKRTTASHTHFNPRTPCGVRRTSWRRAPFWITISIHAPRVGCDPLSCPCQLQRHQFQSTHPVWGATADHQRAGV